MALYNSKKASLGRWRGQTICNNLLQPLKIKRLAMQIIRLILLFKVYINFKKSQILPAPKLQPKATNYANKRIMRAA
ncbi:hypothetical protein CWI73_07295 [Idiomarina piscisalsi]|uniref:Uncharacterized protein n=1 Tax=Idiomarina piscisalsi TaxID=1096243 RepID=A0A432YS86_9GAMM|nr:hypothetical protein CWI73_07295 [Idiomarina piscisalsi]